MYIQGSEKYAPTFSRTDIEVTGEQIASGLNVPLQVRRGSEPALNQLIGISAPINCSGSTDSRSSNNDPSKRWSAAPIINDDHPHLIDRNHTNGYLTPEEEDSLEEDRFLRITRDGSNRLSMQFLDGTG